MQRPLLLLGLGCLALTQAARGEVLNLRLHTNLDISGVHHSSSGDLAYDYSAGKLFLADGAASGLIYEVSTSSGALIGSIDPSVIPGLSNGPDALALHQTGSANDDLFVFSSFGESEAGRITHAGNLVSNFGNAHGATGADTDAAGNLWISSGTVAGGGTVLERLDPTTGAVLQSVPVLANTLRMMDITFDPFSGALYCLREDGILAEVNLTTGAQISLTDLNPFLFATNLVTGGITFVGDGGTLLVTTGSGTAADNLVVLTREFDRTICESHDPSFPCPCANAGAPGHGCENSFSTGGGLLSTGGLPRVSDDSLRLFASDLPPSTSCLFFQGTLLPESGPPPFGDGLRCIVGTVIRLGTKATVNGIAQFPSTNDPSISVRGQIPASGTTTRYYQAWYRNVASFCTPAGFNLTNGIQVIWRP